MFNTLVLIYILYVYSFIYLQFNNEKPEKININILNTTLCIETTIIYPRQKVFTVNYFFTT